MAAKWGNVYDYIECCYAILKKGGGEITNTFSKTKIKEIQKDHWTRIPIEQEWIQIKIKSAFLSFKWFIESIIHAQSIFFAKLGNRVDLFWVWF